MKNKFLFGLIKDTHLNQNNGSIVLNIFYQFIVLLKSKDIKYAIHLGDFFSERTGGHNIERLMTIGLIIRMFIDAEIKLFAIQGNHDKTDLSHDLGYLNVYDVVAKSEYFELFSGYDFVDFDKYSLRVHFIPYFTEGEAYTFHLNKANKFVKPNYKNILCTHIAINGVRNNDGSIVEDGENIQTFKNFSKVYVGHYHDESFIKPNIHYIPGSYQQNFGETEHKGFTLLTPDLKTEFYKSEFKPYRQLKVVASDKNAIKEITKELATMDLEACHVRVKVVGNQNEIESFDSNQLKKLGVEVKKENIVETNIEIQEPEECENVTLTKTDILKNYIKYAQEFSFTAAQRSQGLKYLKTI